MNPKSAKTTLQECLKAYGKAIDKAVVDSIIKNGKRKRGWFIYNAASGYLNLHTGEYVQDGAPVWKKFKITTSETK